MKKTPQVGQVPNQSNPPVTKTPQMQQSQTQSQQQGQGASAPRRQFVDPLGRPLHQGSPRFTDQQAGGDLTGDESDARDDNFVVSGRGQSARDVSAHAELVPPASADAQRYLAVADVAPVDVDAAPQPDGTEDPGANADDGLMPRQLDGSASEQH